MLGRGNVAHDVEPHAAQKRGVVDARREFGIRLEDLLGQQPVDLPGGLLGARAWHRHAARVAESANSKSKPQSRNLPHGRRVHRTDPRFGTMRSVRPRRRMKSITAAYIVPKPRPAAMVSPAAASRFESEYREI